MIEPHFSFLRLGKKLEDFSGTYDKMNCQCALVRDRFVLGFFNTFYAKHLTTYYVSAASRHVIPIVDMLFLRMA